MPLKKRNPLFIILPTLLFLFWSHNLLALTTYSRQESAKNPTHHTTNRFGYIQGAQYMPGPEKQKPCVPHGQARCMFNASRPNYHSRYTNRIAEKNKVPPLLRSHYKYKTVQNF